MCNGLWEYIVSEINIIPRTVYVVMLSIIIVGVIALIAWKRKESSKYISGLLLGEYLFIIFGLTVIYRKTHHKVSHFITPFWSYKVLFQGEAPSLLDEIIMNVVLFIPVGLLLGSQLTKDTKKKRWLVVILVGMGISLGIEVLQMTFKKGSFEFDDIFHNTLGCLIGFLLWQGMAKLTGRIKKVW